MTKATLNPKDQGEIWGLRFEFYGILVATLSLGYQYLFTDFFSSYALDKLADNQTTANVDILRAINLLSLQVSAARDATEGAKRAEDFSEKTSADIGNVIDANEERRELLSGQGAAFKLALNWLTIVGALAAVLGKWLQLKYKEREFNGRAE